MDNKEFIHLQELIKAPNERDIASIEELVTTISSADDSFAKRGVQEILSELPEDEEIIDLSMNQSESLQLKNILKGL
ncbi:MAG: hypothetical protein MK193_04835 [Lentisphaeria bacterium]|nr:hypothetical protein [Lentisphaeria bacterium]